MEHNIELIKQIRESLAKEQGYKSFASMALNVNIVPSDITEIAKKYAEGMTAALQSKCDRYEKALKEIGERNCDYQTLNESKLHSVDCKACIANEALNGEEEECSMCNEKPRGEHMTVCNDCYESFDGDRRGFWTSDVYQ